MFSIIPNELLLHVAAVYIYDFLLTIAEEKQHFWRRRFSYISALFFINRYVVLLNRLVRLVNVVHWRGELTGGPDNVSAIILPYGNARSYNPGVRQIPATRNFGY